MATQKFRFADLYTNNRKAVEDTLLSMWCGETKNESQRNYVKQLKSIISNIFAPREAMPLVECMNSYKSVFSVDAAEAERLVTADGYTPEVGNLWRKSMPEGKFYPPYQHQYDSWNTLLNKRTADDKPMSIVVTTGTGSGKTECFMMPLVKDIMEHPKGEAVQAIFLYPLNALMEDQKERLERLLTGTKLTYAVYNGDLPERLPDEGSSEYESVLRKIDDIKGITRNENGDIVEMRFPKAIATRDELRQHPANILLTNPTMLEYVLLRGSDAKLIEKESLSWIAIDETHTYTGAGAAEIAMLLRRVLMAYEVDTSKVRFATSSATIGNSNDEETSKKELKRFIAGITGLELRQVEVIDGERKGIENIPHDENEKYWLRLIKDNESGYLPLDKLFDDDDNTEQKLAHLDRMCQKAEDENLQDLRVKVHYFYRVPNHGLFADITQQMDGCFKIYTENRIDAGRGDMAPLLELSRCKHCGEYVAVAQVDYNESTFSPITMDESDMFDLEETEDEKKKYLVFGLSKEEVSLGDNNASFIVHGNKFTEAIGSDHSKGYWHVVGNTQCSCPYCGTKLTKNSKVDMENPELQQQEEQDMKKLQKFRVASDFISRLLAPSVLDLMTEAEPKDKSKIALHQGQQYISFVDSRQAAAQSTIKQNLEEERLWVYSRIFHELSRRTAEGMTKEEAIRMQEAKVRTAPSDEMMKEMAVLMNLNSPDDTVWKKQLAALTGTAHLTWKEMFDLLYNDPLRDVFCTQFAERSEESTECRRGKLTDAIRIKYIQSLLVQYLEKHPISAAAPETMGLFTSYYPKLERAMNDELPEAVKSFNAMLTDENKIGKKDWHDLMQVFLDYTVRSNQSVYLKMSDSDPIDIFQCVRFATQKERRRPVIKPQVYESSTNLSRVVCLLATLLAKSKNETLKNIVRTYKTAIQCVIDALWIALTETYDMISHSTHYDEELHIHVKDKDMVKDDVHFPPMRMNLADMSVTLFDEAYLCDTNVSKENESRHVSCLRPIKTLFKGYSPYLIGGEATKISKDMHEKWSAYPYYKHSDNRDKADKDTVVAWAKEHRALLWKHNLWGENGVFAERLQKIYQYPNLFIQAEHTAQVDKMISRQVQKDFKDHCINILACSTTMEMGVDLGDLELVMMTSVPPQPSNYKQRAGRSGRRGQVRSAAVTLCGSDTIGMRTLFDPMGSLILRKVASPTVDLNSAKVIQRHINSFLIREFGVFNMGVHAGSITQHVIDYYTNFKIERDGRSCHATIKKIADNAPVGPADGLGNPENTPYETFNEECTKPLSKALRQKLNKLLEDTIYSGCAQQVVDMARKMNEQCYAELERRLSDLGLAYQEAKSARQQAFFMLKYIEPLDTQLLNYWATHRFTPNANMPVNVVEFDINSLKQTTYKVNTPSNPSYPLRTALAQYAPGNPIARDGMVRIVRGIRYADFFRPVVTFKQLSHNCDQVVIDGKENIDNLLVWPVSGSVDLDLLQPTEFIPDMNETANRILDRNEYTRVSAQLIGAEPWEQDRTEPHLFDARNNRESGDAQILYYNEGLGYGYCHCTKCGKTVLERWAAGSASNPDKLPADMSQVAGDDDKPFYHHSIAKKHVRCMGCNSPEYIKRNVVLGDTILTDYTEIRIRHLNEDWISSRQGHLDLLTTLGILITQALAEILNVERSDLDFTITPNGHICVFDTNPGGSGYSNQLAGMDLLKDALKLAYKYLDVAERSNSKDVLIDRNTLFCQDHIDVKAAKSWLDEEFSAQKELPENIKSIFPDATETSLIKMLRSFAISQKESTLFVDNDYESWNYDASEASWRGHFYNYFANRGQQTAFCVAASTDEAMQEPNKDMLRSLKGWMKTIVGIWNPFAEKKLYPLAYIDGRLYFTNNPAHKTLDERWGGGTIYYAKVGNPALNGETIDTRVENANTSIFTLGMDDECIIDTSMLGKIIENHAPSLIGRFVEHCNKHNAATLKVTYQDEHLKSILSMVLCLQTVEHFIKECNLPFTLQFKVEVYGDNEYGKADSITSNQPQSRNRDTWLQRLATAWIGDMKRDAHIAGTLTPIESLPKRTLTHWRALTLECAGKQLCIYPDGGFMNGWHVYNEPNKYVHYDTQTITHDTVIKLQRNQEIKFDVTIKDI